MQPPASSRVGASANQTNPAPKLQKLHYTERFVFYRAPIFLNELALRAKRLDSRSLWVQNVLTMHVIALKQPREFWTKHPGAEAPLKRWYKIASAAEWEGFNDVRAVFSSADVWTSGSGRNYVIFNIGGNNFRLVVSIWYEGRRIYIKHVMTHAEYDRDTWKEDL